MYTTKVRDKQIRSLGEFVIYGIRVRVETLGPIWAQYAPTYFVSELMTEFFLAIIENQQVHIVLQHRYLKMYQTRILIDLVVVEEKEEHLLKITLKMAITFATSMLGR